MPCFVRKDCMFQGVYSISQGIQFCNYLKDRGEQFDRIHGTGEEKHRHDDEIHYHAEAFVTLIECGKDDYKRRYAEGDRSTDCNDGNNLHETQLESDNGEKSEDY